MTVEEVERRLSWSSGRATDALETLLDVSAYFYVYSVHMDSSHLMMNSQELCLFTCAGGACND